MHASGTFERDFAIKADIKRFGLNVSPMLLTALLPLGRLVILQAFLALLAPFAGGTAWVCSEVSRLSIAARPVAVMAAPFADISRNSRRVILPLLPES